MAGLKTLVVDADVEKSFLTKRLLGRMVSAEPAALRIVHASERPFDVLPSSVVEAWNLRTPKNMEAFLADLGASDVAGCELAYDIVIVDMPTLVSGADDLILGSVLDGVIVIAEWGKTHIETLRELVRTLQAGRTQVLGVLLAGCRTMTSKHRRALPKHGSFGAHQSV
jgi:Mrp family chromosome partitioning ATPase